MVFAVVGCPFSRYIASRSGIYKMYAFRSNLPATNCSLVRSVQNRQIEQQTSFPTISSFLQSDPIVKEKSP